MSPQHKIINSVIFKPINDGFSSLLNSIFSINKELSNSAKLSKLSLSTFDNISKMIDKYNKQVVGSEVNKENWDNQPTLSTFTAYTQQLPTNERATREGYNQYISQYSTGLTGVSNTMAQYNKLAEKGISNQNEYAKAIATTNPKLGSYLTSLNGAKAGMSGYAIQLAGATLKTVALQAATIALDAALSMGISLAIGGLISGIDYLVHRNEKLIESANEVTNTYRDQAKTLSEGITSLQEQQNDFDSLAKGVDEYGNNISLTTDQYKQYQSIVSEILGYSPELIAGYDEEGNAIAKKNGLIEESIRLMKEERKQKLNEITTASNTKTIYKGAKAEYNNSRGDLTNESFDVPVQSELHSPLNNYGKGSDSFSNVYTVQHFNSIIKDITGEDFLDGEKLTDYLKRNEEIIKKNYDEISRQMKQDVHTANGTIFGLSKDDTQTFVNWLQEVYSSIDEVEKKSHGMDEQFNLFAQKSDAYEKLTNEQKNFITEYIKETGKITDAEGKLLSDDELLNKANNYKAFVDELDKRADVKEAITSFYTAPEDDESIPEYISSVKDAFTIIQEFAKENGVEIPLDFTKDYDDLESQYNDIISSLQKKFSNDDFDWDAWFKENSINTKEELDAWLQVTNSINNAAQARKAYLDYMNKQELDTKSLKELNDSLDKIQSAYQVASTAIEEYNENGYISVDTFQSLMELEPEYLNLLMDENGTLALTSENLYKLTEARINDLAAKQASTLVDSVTKLGSEAEQLQYLTQATDGATESTWGLVYAKIAEAQAAGTISDDVAGRLKSQVEAYQTWANAAIDGINKGSLGKSSNSSKSKEDNAKALKDYEDKVKDINEKLEELDKAEYLANLKYSIETITQDLNKFEQSLDRLSSKLDLTFEKDYSAKLSIIGQQFLGASRYGGEMRVELERLLAIEPQTADEAEELASRLESLSDSFFENEKNIIEYRNSLFETATDYLGESASATVEQVNNAKSILDNTFNVIKNGSLSGDGFWSATLLPSISKDKVTKQRAENNKLIKEEKRYQNAIAKIRKKATDMSYAEEKEEREKQRQEYQEELQEAYEDYQDKINDVIGQNIEVSDSVKNIGDEYMNTADEAESSAGRQVNAAMSVKDAWAQAKQEKEDALNSQFEPSDSKKSWSPYLSTPTSPYQPSSKSENTNNNSSTVTKGKKNITSAHVGNDGKVYYKSNGKEIAFGKMNISDYNLPNTFKVWSDGSVHAFYGSTELYPAGSVNFYAKGGTTSQGLTITGDGTGAYAGQEAYIGQDGKLHLFNNEAQLSELPPNTRIVNAKDLQNIIKYTGMKYFYQPIENIQSATVDKFAQGNTNVSFSPIPYNTLSTQALYSDVDVQAMVEETIAEINNEFNALKGNIKFSAVQNAFKNSLTDKKMYKDLSNTIVNMTSQSLDKADKSTLSDSVVGLILQNSAWDDLPNELQNKLSELNVNADNWTDWIKDSNNSLQAFNLMQDGGMSSWDLLDSNVTSLLQQAGINGKDAWDKFVQDDPLQALTLLSSSWNSMNDTIGQYMTDAKTIAANGARAIQSLQIIAPSISEQSWNALQVLIANKIQEIISLMNEVFGENTVD